MLAHYRNFGLDVDINNLLACFPAGDTGMIKFGAKKKDGWYIENDFISPLSPGCDSRFIFTEFGEIKAHKNDSAALETIVILGLDHRELVDMRLNG